ncbi:hypothetical protein JW758_04345 [Candidatus Peregrinibacteria bacterium]|nr:hypothetical protein [Candidatus Peregrinibacteria bacterium]
MPPRRILHNDNRIYCDSKELRPFVDLLKNELIEIMRSRLGEELFAGVKDVVCDKETNLSVFRGVLQALTLRTKLVEIANTANYSIEFLLHMAISEIDTDYDKARFEDR